MTPSLVYGNGFAGFDGLRLRAGLFLAVTFFSGAGLPFVGVTAGLSFVGVTAGLSFVGVTGFVAVALFAATLS